MVVCGTLAVWTTTACPPSRACGKACPDMPDFWYVCHAVMRLVTEAPLAFQGRQLMGGGGGAVHAHHVAHVPHRSGRVRRADSGRTAEWRVGLHRPGAVFCGGVLPQL